MISTKTTPTMTNCSIGVRGSLLFEKIELDLDSKQHQPVSTESSAVVFSKVLDDKDSVKNSSSSSSPPMLTESALSSSCSTSSVATKTTTTAKLIEPTSTKETSLLGTTTADRAYIRWQEYATKKRKQLSRRGDCLIKHEPNGDGLRHMNQQRQQAEAPFVSGSGKRKRSRETTFNETPSLHSNENGGDSNIHTTRTRTDTSGNINNISIENAITTSSSPSSSSSSDRSRLFFADRVARYMQEVERNRLSDDDDVGDED